MNRRSLALLLFALGCLDAAQAQPVDSRSYALGPFDAIEISGSAVVRFTQGESEQVIVEGEDGVQRSVDMEVRRGTLNIRQGGSWKFWNARRLQILVTARTLRSVVISGSADLVAPQPVNLEQLTINISGAGTARFDQLKADKLVFQVSGAGDGQMAGEVKALSVHIAGKSSFQGARLMSERAQVSISGVGNVGVWAVRELGIAVAGIGTVDYWGTPVIVKRSISGRAEITDHGAK